MNPSPIVDADLVRGLIAAQFPHWAHLPVRPVARDGWDNWTFHLGDALKVRLPSAAAYVAQVEKEHRWLPRLAPHLPLPVPEPLALGAPDPAYPWPWSVYRWLPGEPASRGRVADLPGFARDLARFLTALRAADAREGPPPGPHNFFRGAPPAVYDAETRAALGALAGRVDTAAAAAVWAAALAAPAWSGPPVWCHGDVAAGNLLLGEDGCLAGVIDFGSSAVGDPACDLAIAWTLLDGPSRAAFRVAMGLDPATWARGRGWALWKALIVLAAPPSRAEAGHQRHVLDEVLADARAEGS